MVIWCAFALAGVFDTLFSFINIQFRSWQNTDLETMGPKVWTCLFVFLASRSLGLCSVLMVISQGEIFIVPHLLDTVPWCLRSKAKEKSSQVMLRTHSSQDPIHSQAHNTTVPFLLMGMIIVESLVG